MGMGPKRLAAGAVIAARDREFTENEARPLHLKSERATGGRWSAWRRCLLCRSGIPNLTWLDYWLNSSQPPQGRGPGPTSTWRPALPEQ